MGSAESMGAALSRLGYVTSSSSVSDLVNAFLYDPEGKFFHTRCGDFARIYKLPGFDESVLTLGVKDVISQRLANVLNSFPEDSYGQFLRITHRDIRPVIQAYASRIDNTNPFSRDYARSSISRQVNAGVNPQGFFASLDKSKVQQASADAVRDLTDPNDRDAAYESISDAITHGAFPLVSELYLVVYWRPAYQQKSILNTVQRVFSSVGASNGAALTAKAYAAEARKFIKYCADIEAQLSAGDFNASRVTGQGLVDILYRQLNPVRSYYVDSPRYVSNRPIMDLLQEPMAVKGESIGDKVSFSAIETSSKGWDIHYEGTTTYQRIASVKLPPDATIPGMISHALSKVEGEGIIAVNFKMVSALDTAARMFLRQRAIATKENVPFLRGDAETFARNREDVSYVTSATSASNITSRQRLMDTSIFVMLQGPVEEIVEEKISKVEKLLWNAGVVERDRADAMIHHILPLNFVPEAMPLIKRDIPFLSIHVADMMPVYVGYRGSSSIAVLANNGVGMPIGIDLWGPEVITGHSLITGTTGSGKSFAFNMLLMGIRATIPQVRTVIIDKGRSYESLCYSLDGEYIELLPDAVDDKQPTCINPFFIPPNKEGKVLPPSNDEIVFLRDLIVMMIVSGSNAASVSPEWYNCIYRALRDFYDGWDMAVEPTMSDFVKALKNTQLENVSGAEIADTLMMYYGDGGYAKIFDGKLSINWDNQFIVVETERMATSKCMPVVMLALFRQIELTMKYKVANDIPKIIAVDEAWATLANPICASALAGFFREARKYKGACLLISQTIADWVKLIKAEGAAEGGILENTSHFFLLACTRSDYDLSKQFLGFTDEEVGCWASIGSLPPYFSEVFYRRRNANNSFSPGKIRFYSSPIGLWTASSDPADRKARNDLTAELRKKDRNLSVKEARWMAVRELAEKYPYGMRYS